MLLMHKSLKRSEDIMRSFRRYAEVNFKEIDGIIECFNNKIGQGYIIKIFDSYNKENDLVVWIFESLNEKNIQIAFSIHNNIDDQNNWINKEKVNFKRYPIKKDIKRNIILDVCDLIKDYYGFNEEIEQPKEINI